MRWIVGKLLRWLAWRSLDGAYVGRLMLRLKTLVRWMRRCVRKLLRSLRCLTNVRRLRMVLLLSQSSRMLKMLRRWEALRWMVGMMLEEELR